MAQQNMVRNKRGSVSANSNLLGMLLTVVTLSFFAGQASATEEQLDNVFSELEATKQVHQRAESRVSASVERRRDLISEYVRLERELENRQIYNSELNLQIRNQKARVAVLRNSLVKVDQVQDALPPLLRKMTDVMKQFIMADLPFSQEARLANVQAVEETLLQPIPISQKVSTVLDLYEQELAYGKTIDAYADNVNIDGRDREVKILRWGRVAMIYQTPDTYNAGLYDAQSGDWKALTLHHRNEINKAIRMAEKLASLDLVILPIHAPKDLQFAGE